MMAGALNVLEIEELVGLSTSRPSVIVEAPLALERLDAVPRKRKHVRLHSSPLSMRTPRPSDSILFEGTLALKHSTGALL